MRRAGTWGRRVGFATRWQEDVGAVAVNAAGRCSAGCGTPAMRISPLAYMRCDSDRDPRGGQGRSGRRAVSPRRVPFLRKGSAGASSWESPGTARQHSCGGAWRGRPRRIARHADRAVAATWPKTRMSGLRRLRLRRRTPEASHFDVDEHGRAVAAWRGSPDPVPGRDMQSRRPSEATAPARGRPRAGSPPSR